MCRVQKFIGSVGFFWFLFCFLFSLFFWGQAFDIERHCYVFVAGTNIQTNEEVGIKLVRTLATLNLWFAFAIDWTIF